MKKTLIIILVLSFFSFCNVQDCWYFHYAFVIIENKTDDVYLINSSYGNFIRELDVGKIMESSHVPIGDIEIKYKRKDFNDNWISKKHYIDKCEIHKLIIKQ